MNPIAAANQIAQERTVETISYPITGDREVDTITAICALLWTSESRSILKEEAMLRVLEYVRSRVCERLNERRKQEDMWKGVQGTAGQSLVDYTHPSGLKAGSGLGAGGQDAINVPRESLRQRFEQMFSQSPPPPPAPTE